MGYRVFCGPATLSGAARGHVSCGSTPITWCARTQQALYGFRTTEELGFFELLTTVTGVGPKVALAIVSSRPVTDLQLAILQGDEGVLTAVSGVGKKLAARVVLELREKVSAAGAVAAGGAANGVGVGGRGRAAGAWLQRRARRARLRAGAMAALPVGASLEDRVKAALRVLRRD